jgi:hypothetical protein
MQQSGLTHQELCTQRLNQVVRPDEVASVIKQQFGLVNSPDLSTRTQSRDIFFSYLYGFAWYHTDFESKTGLIFTELEQYKIERFSQDIPAEAISTISDFIDSVYPPRVSSPSMLVSSMSSKIGEKLLSAIDTVKGIFKK